MSEWTRAHDALIAERAEGLHPRKEMGTYGEVWVVEHRNRGGENGWHGTVPLDHYNTDLAAVARAMEAWRLQDADFRAYEVEAVGGSFRCECRDWDHDDYHPHRFSASDTTEAASRAAALLQAVGVSHTT